MLTGWLDLADKLQNTKILWQINVKLKQMLNSSKAIMHLVAIRFGCWWLLGGDQFPSPHFLHGFLSLETEKLKAKAFQTRSNAVDKIKMLFNEIHPDLSRVLRSLASKLTYIGEQSRTKHCIHQFYLQSLLQPHLINQQTMRRSCGGCSWPEAPLICCRITDDMSR